MKANGIVSMFGGRCRFSSARWAAIVIAAVLAVAGLDPPAAQAQSTIHVPSDHATIQAAINASSSGGGDEIIVAPGTYNEAINFGGKAVHLRSSDGPAVTIIDATGLDASVVTCANGEGADTVLEGFTITGGTGTLVSGSMRGGGMYNLNSSPTVMNCIFENNSANAGGGMYNGNSAPTVTNCTFENNSAGVGGGMYNVAGSPSITNCVFVGNTAGGSGGGMYSHGGSPMVTNCTFQNNSANSSGGGVFNTSSSPTVMNCTFEGNSASSGGGIYNSNSSPVVTNCTFTENSANSIGGGMFNATSSPSVTNCTFQNNSANSSGGGLYNSGISSPTLTNSTFQNNSASEGGGMFNSSSSPTVANCVFENNSATFVGGGMCNSGSSPTVTNCTFQTNSATFGGGMLNVGSNSSPTVADSVFSMNSASRDGGGMYNYSSSSPTVTNCIFDSNTAVFNGGGMLIQSDSGAAIGTCEFRNNSAGAGGGVWSASFDTTVADTLFCENTPDNIISRWTDSGGVEFRVTCAVAGAPPVAVCNAYAFDGDPSEGGSDITLQCHSYAGRLVTLDATGSYHPDDEMLTYRWDISDLDVTLDDLDSAIATGMFPIGVTMATLTVTDPFGAFSTCDAVIRVHDVLPPQVMVTSNAAVLWPPNHTMRAVQVIVTATDECFEPGFIFPIDVMVRSSEPDNASGNGDGDTTGDCNGEDGFAASANITSAFEWDEDLEAWVAIIYLRAERAGSGKGRSYTIDAMAFDGSSNFGMSSCVIVVPKGMGGGGN